MSKIPTDGGSISDIQVLEAFQLTYPGLENVKAAVLRKDMETAKQELVEYFHTRRNVKFLFDYRGKPLRKIEYEVNPYFFQASVGLKENVKDFCLFAGKHLMKDIYMMPGRREGGISLGRGLEKAPMYNHDLDYGKRSRNEMNLFSRGQWIEYLFFLYQETGDSRVYQKMEEMLEAFFIRYALNVENEQENAERFQYTKERTVMSVGWLILCLTELLYTETAYEMRTKAIFDVVKRIWFLGIQFDRFSADTYRSYNHHLWERGLVPYLLGVMFPEIPKFAAMKERGAKIICQHVCEDFNREGGYSEHSISYWSGATIGEMLFKGIYLARMNQEVLLDEDSAKRFQNSLTTLAQLTPPGDLYPVIGDGGGTMVSAFLQLGGNMLGNKACREVWDFRCGKTKEVPALPYYYCSEETGYACARTGFGKKDTYLIMSIKGDGGQRCIMHGAPGHDHIDMMSVSLTVNGVEMIGEPYAGDLYHHVKHGDIQRGYLYNMTSHNSVLAYGESIQQDEMYVRGWDTFSPACHVRKFQTEDEGMEIEVIHDGYSCTRHIRSVMFLKNGIITVQDKVAPGYRVMKPHIQRWNHAGQIKIWKNTSLLCPSVYESEEKLAKMC